MLCSPPTMSTGPLPQSNRRMFFSPLLKLMPSRCSPRFGQLARLRFGRFLNPVPPVDFPYEILKLVDICLPNESELVALTGFPIEELPRAADELRREGPKAVVVTLGNRGAFLMDDRGAELIPACPVQAVDTSGAGDAFAASWPSPWEKASLCGSGRMGESGCGFER